MILMLKAILILCLWHMHSHMLSVMAPLRCSRTSLGPVASTSPQTSPGENMNSTMTTMTCWTSAAKVPASLRHKKSYAKSGAFLSPEFHPMPHCSRIHLLYCYHWLQHEVMVGHVWSCHLSSTLAKPTRRAKRIMVIQIDGYIKLVS